MNYLGTIIEESLEDKHILDDVKILETEVEPVTGEHKTPWLKQWTLHKVEIGEDQAEIFAGKISRALDHEHAWYADFKNDQWHFIIFRGKVFKIDRTRREQYDAAAAFGLSIGIPDYQLDFSPHILPL